jgi:hypothetical protein
MGTVEREQRHGAENCRLCGRAKALAESIVDKSCRISGDGN